MKKLLFSIFTLCIAFSIQAQDHTKDVDIYKNMTQAANAQYQKELRANTVWKAFAVKHPTWYVEFNEASKMPHMACGSSIDVAGSSFQDKALNFLKTELGMYNVPTQDLVFKQESTGKKWHTVGFQQTYNGLDVFDAYAAIQFNKKGEIFKFNLEIFKDINIETTPSFDIETAKIHARKGILEPITEISAKTELVVVPVPSYNIRSYAYKLAYQVTVETIDEENIPGKYETLVDAKTGEILFRKNRVMHCMHGKCKHNHAKGPKQMESTPIKLNVTPSPDGMSLIINMEATVYELNPYVPTITVGLAEMEAVVGGTTYYSDSAGNFNIPITTNTSITFNLRGRRSTVYTGATGTNNPSLTTTAGPGTTNFNFNNVGGAQIQHVTAYYHVGLIYHFMKSYITRPTSLDQSMTTRVERTDGTCNAFYNGSSINFYTDGGGCYSLAKVADVVYHEYGHGINDNNFTTSVGTGMSNGAMNEGYADVWAVSLTQNPVLGVGFSNTNQNSVVRRYDINPKVYPQDYAGQIHADGEIICGAWHQTSLNIGSIDTMMQIFTEIYLSGAPDNNSTSMMAIGQLYREVLVAALYADDDDMNETNGAPHGWDIVNAFAAHGITLFDNLNVLHTDVKSHTGNTDVTIAADLISIGSPVWTFYTSGSNNNLYIYHRNQGQANFTKSTMMNTTGTTYEFDIPGQGSATIIEYYLSLEGQGGNSIIVDPSKADDAMDPTLPYYILVNFNQQRSEDFDGLNSFGNWQQGIPSDDATTGQWIISVPTPSYNTGGGLVQTDMATSGLVCAITGNATSPTSGIGENDIDDGTTTLLSPPIDMSIYSDPAVTLQRWYTNAAGASPNQDDWVAQVSNDGTTWVDVENTKTTDQRWRRFAFKVKDYINPSATTYIRFLGSDLNDGSLVEAAIDDIVIYDAMPVSVNDLDKAFNQINIYPNPTQNSSTIDFELVENQNITLELSNSLGQIIQTKNLGELQIGIHQHNLDLSDVAAGIYTLSLKYNGGIVSRKLTVMSK